MRVCKLLTYFWMFRVDNNKFVALWYAEIILVRSDLKQTNKGLEFLWFQIFYGKVVFLPYK